MKIKSTNPETQGEFVEIDDENFDGTKMEAYEPEPQGKKARK